MRDVPIYIPSKSRSDTALTMAVLDDMKIPHKVIVEEKQWSAYAERWGKDRLIVLDPAYQRDYDTFDELGDSKSKGPGPARNMAWDHAVSSGADWHWVMDDNIRAFMRFNRNTQFRAGDETFFTAMEDFATRYTNTAMLGPNYSMFAPTKTKHPPFVTGTRIYSCNLIRNSIDMRWRGRYNEDTDLSLRMLKDGWATVQFYAFLADKIATQLIKGGNTEAFYAGEGTAAKSHMLVAMHPDVAKIKYRFKRVHHLVDYEQWRGQPLIRDPHWSPPSENKYKEKFVSVTDEAQPAIDEYKGL